MRLGGEGEGKFTKRSSRDTMWYHMVSREVMTFSHYKNHHVIPPDEMSPRGEWWCPLLASSHHVNHVMWWNFSHGENHHVVPRDITWYHLIWWHFLMVRFITWYHVISQDVMKKGGGGRRQIYQEIITWYHMISCDLMRLDRILAGRINFLPSRVDYLAAYTMLIEFHEGQVLAKG